MGEDVEGGGGGEISARAYPEVDRKGASGGAVGNRV